MDKELISFLLTAKKSTYAGKGAETTSSRPQSHDLIYREGDRMYYDTYLGSNEFVVEEALWVQGTPAWSMNYAGRVTGQPFSGDFLKEALLRVPADKPFRGPALFVAGDYAYTCEVSGDTDWFQGHERIFFKGTEIYDCYFHGSSVKATPSNGLA